MNSFIAKYLFYYPVTILNGEKIYKYRNEYNSFQWLTEEKVNAIKQNNLEKILEYAKTNSKYYSELLKNQGDINFTSIPLLSKQDLILHFEDISTKFKGKTSLKTTGGSTGEPVKLLKNSDALARERTATWRSYNWAGVDIGDKQARFWGVPHGKGAARKSSIIDVISNRKRISAFNLTDDYMNTYYRLLEKFKPTYLYGYVSVVRKFSEFIRDNNLPPIKSVNSIITTSEVLSEFDRNSIESCWGKKVFNEYGCGEVGSIAHECEEGSMHIVSDNLHVEILNSTGSPSETGEIIVTDYFNLATPLIRYRLGDFGTISKERCRCGRSLPVIKSIHGRAYDLIKTPSGRSIHPEALIYIFEDIQQRSQAFHQFQIIQRTLQNIDIFVIPAINWSDSVRNEIENSISNKIDSSFAITFILLKEIAREKSGKMRVVKSELK